MHSGLEPLLSTDIVCKTYHALVVMVAVQLAVSAPGVLLLFLKDIKNRDYKTLSVFRSSKSRSSGGSNNKSTSVTRL